MRTVLEAEVTTFYVRTVCHFVVSSQHLKPTRLLLYLHAGVNWSLALLKVGLRDVCLLSSPNLTFLQCN